MRTNVGNVSRMLKINWKVKRKCGVSINKSKWYLLKCAKRVSGLLGGLRCCAACGGRVKWKVKVGSSIWKSHSLDWTVSSEPEIGCRKVGELPQGSSCSNKHFSIPDSSAHPEFGYLFCMSSAGLTFSCI